ncbi:MAG: hypothetical protein PHF00_12635 [Elusimicrobia bacterium]|nr:hypothetical protein [Elusimicrobiota bacterium]
MTRAALLALTLLPLGLAPARAQQRAETRRADIERRVQVIGTVLAVDVFRLKANIEGRAENIWPSTGVWVKPADSLGSLVNKEFAALTDAPGSTRKSVMADRWNPVYRPSPLRCPSTCFILKIFARSRQWVKPQAVLVEAAGHLRMVGRVSPEDAPLVRDGMLLTYWPANNPRRRFQTRIARYVLDVQGEKVDPAGTFTMDEAMGPGRFLPPGTNWEGVIVAQRSAGAVLVPTQALLRFGGEVFLPVRVSTGITTRDWTEITAGVEAKRPFLVLDDKELPRHKIEPGDGAAGPGAPAPAPAGTQPPPPDEPPAPAVRAQPPAVETSPEPGADPGEDPYSE